MSNSLTTLRVQQIEKSTPDCALITFNIPAEKHAEFDFKQGQYLTLRAEIKGEKVQRSYSLCSSPLDQTWTVGIKKIPGGKFSTYANEVLRVGDTLEAMAPAGKFFIDCEPKQKRNYIAFAGGSGITPIFSIIKTHLESEPESTFKLFYVNRTAQSVILKEQIEALKNKFMGRFETFYFLTREHRSSPFLNGRLDEEKLDTIFEHLTELNSIDHFFTCGPQAMTEMISQYLQNKRTDSSKIHFELFTTADAKQEERREIAEQFVGEKSQITIVEGGKSFNFDMETGANNLLDAAMNNGADLPYACKGGVCCTCKAKLVEGEVEMLIHYGLEPDEIAAKYILTCQAIPTTPEVVVDFDQ